MITGIVTVIGLTILYMIFEDWYMNELINEIDISLACCLDDISEVTEDDIEHIYQNFEKLMKLLKK